MAPTSTRTGASAIPVIGMTTWALLSLTAGSVQARELLRGPAYFQPVGKLVQPTSFLTQRVDLPLGYITDAANRIVEAWERQLAGAMRAFRKQDGWTDEQIAEIYEEANRTLALPLELVHRATSRADSFVSDHPTKRSLAGVASMIYTWIASLFTEKEVAHLHKASEANAKVIQEAAEIGKKIIDALQDLQYKAGQRGALSRQVNFVAEHAYYLASRINGYTDGLYAAMRGEAHPGLLPQHLIEEVAGEASKTLEAAALEAVHDIARDAMRMPVSLAGGHKEGRAYYSLLLHIPTVRNKDVNCRNLYRFQSAVLRRPDGGWQEYTPASKYIAVTEDEQQYSTHTSEQIEICHHVADFHYCRQDSITYKVPSDCLAALFHADTDKAESFCGGKEVGEEDPVPRVGDHTYLIQPGTNCVRKCRGLEAGKMIRVAQGDQPERIAVPPGCTLSCPSFFIDPIGDETNNTLAVYHNKVERPGYQSFMKKIMQDAKKPYNTSGFLDEAAGAFTDLDVDLTEILRDTSRTIQHEEQAATASHQLYLYLLVGGVALLLLVLIIAATYLYWKKVRGSATMKVKSHTTTATEQAIRRLLSSADFDTHVDGTGRVRLLGLQDSHGPIVHFTKNRQRNLDSPASPPGGCADYSTVRNTGEQNHTGREDNGTRSSSIRRMESNNNSNANRSWPIRTMGGNSVAHDAGRGEHEEAGVTVTRANDAAIMKAMDF